jgi:hypothetical protein
MPTFDTPEPISASIELPAGRLWIDAGDRAETTVEVHPSDGADEADVATAEQTQVDFSRGRLLVRAPRNAARWWRFRYSGSVEVRVDLPAGSSVDATVATGEIHCEGRLGEARLTGSSGAVRLDQTGRLRVRSGGAVSVGRSVGHADITTMNGAIWVREIDGPAVVKTANGDITLGEVTGDLRLNTAYGDITVDRALAGVHARTASGSVRIGEVVRGSVDLETAYGDLEIGVREGSAAWLDLRSGFGKVRSGLEPAEGPVPGEATVEVRARTAYGDILIHRS